MLSPQRALLCNLNHIHLQHVSLGLHLSRRPELREGPLSTSPPPGDTGGKESRGPCSGALVDANSNSPAVPCRCCQEHGPGLENRQDPAQEEEGAASPSDPGCSSSLSSCSDLSPDESPISVYSRSLPGDGDVHPQPSIIPLEQGSPLASAGPGACSPDSFCCSPDSCSGASSPPGPDLDSNCNALTTCQDPPSPGLEEEDDGGEQDLPTSSELPEAEDEKADAGQTEPSWKINPIWKIDTETTDAGWKTTENNNSGCTISGNTNSSWKTEPGKLDSGWKSTRGVTDSSNTDAGKADAGWRSDVSEEPASHRTITSFHELAQKRKRGPGLPLVPQVKKDRSDWLIVFSPDLPVPLGSSSPIVHPEGQGPLTVLRLPLSFLCSTKQLELWFSSLQEDAGLLSLLYLPTGFLSLARGGCPALSTELLLLLQPLSVLTFHLDLLFEHHHHLPLGPPPPAAAAPGSPPALQQTVHAVLHWGGRLAQSLRGASGETPPGPSAPASAPTPGSWWEQLTQASRVYASGGTEGFPLPRWRSWRPGTAAGGPQERPVPAEDTAPGRGVWLGRLFGVPGGLTETDGGTVKSRRPSSWLPPTVSVLALVKRGAPPEPLSPPEELEASTAGVVQTHRAVRALCDHTAAGPDQLSFRRGEVLRVVATVDEDWLRCGRNGVEGLVPVGYTSLVL
ncbi:LOW QUALITY PROTEIN: RUN and SH3 domain-containing protein 1 [Ursus maritimus]|uniref:LOW QUALITY PROTEIN: RUN and SH3 domain-containing protein 1 n=1 Tax=Ursus maritimus TaxID=29073 RepID=A0A8M1GAI5_URSMA|nr:LOW QUALITY PROTEIN: RUN and SH3 domain-containing protein 1 [Ursus maritimus]